MRWNVAILAGWIGLAAAPGEALTPQLVKEIDTNSVPASSSPAPYLVSDLAPGLIDTSASNSGGTQPVDLFPAGNHLFFLGTLQTSFNDDSFQDIALWASDGTAAGTQPLAQVCPAGGPPLNPFVASAGPLAYFIACSPEFSEPDGIYLWRSDGTRAGTYRLLLDAPNTFAAGSFAVVKSTLFFINQGSLWRTDGSVAGTAAVAAAPAGLSTDLTTFAGKVYFVAPGAPGDDTELWKSDGTAAGTQPFPALSGDEPSLLTPAGSELFFIALASPQGFAQLWATDGKGDPKPVTRFAQELALGDALSLTAAGNRVYFIADDGSGGGDQIWVSDGTAAGTQPATALPGKPFSTSQQPMAPAGSHLVFFAAGQTGTVGLWSTTGTPQSVVSLCTEACSPQEAGNMAVAGARVVFLAGSIENGFALWGTDGTPAGTAKLVEICAPPFCTDTPVLQQAGALVYASDFGDLWLTDGTRSGTRLLDLPSQIHGFDQGQGSVTVAAVGSRLFFAGSELWSTAGAVAASAQLTGTASAASSQPSSYFAVGNKIFFLATTAAGPFPTLYESAGTAATTVPVPGAPPGSSPLGVIGGKLLLFGPGLWVTDGTQAGTVMVSDFGGAGSVNATTVDGGLAFFLTLTETATETSYKVWRSDGTASGTVELGALPAAIFAGSLGGVPQRIAGLWTVGGEFFFVTEDDADFVSSLWRTDGTTAGTIKLGRVPYQKQPEVTAAGGRFYFVGSQNQDSELWQTDGSHVGTPVIAGSQLIGGLADEVGGLTALGDVVYFFFGTPTADGSAVTLWRSDGTSGGTSPIQTFNTGQPTPVPAAPAVFGNRLAFAVDDGVHGAQLWTSDGTTAGTALVHDFTPGPPGAEFVSIAVAADRMFLTADDGVHGPELWQSDGTAAGTRLVQDIWPGPTGADPVGMTQAGNLLYFTADDGIHGAELWALPLSGPAGCQASSTALCLLGNRFRVEAAWIDPQGGSGDGQAVALTPDTGTFWFFSPSNVEVVAKVIDGTAINSSFWFFYGALSNVEYWLTVTDTATGIARRYLNPPGQMASVGDTSAFGPDGAFAIGPSPAVPLAISPSSSAESARPAPSVPAVPAAAPDPPSAAVPAAAPAAATEASCQTASTQLCVAADRFAITVAWEDFSGNRGTGTAVDLTGDTGYFWFFADTNVELVIKVLDGRAVNGRFWVFYGALSDVAYTITVRDTATGNMRTYGNPAGQFASVADTSAF